MDQIVLKYAAGREKLADLIAEAKKAAESLAEDAQYRFAKYYIRVFEKLAENEGFVAKESARLDNILRKGGLAPSKLDELQTKSNILKQFIPKDAEKVVTEKETTEKEVTDKEDTDKEVIDEDTDKEDTGKDEL